eukprot:1925414-Alexandrium_andersonii.AAC.1
MSASLVGSEMCIRDSSSLAPRSTEQRRQNAGSGGAVPATARGPSTLDKSKGPARKQVERERVSG